MASIRVEGRRAPMRVPPQSDGRILVHVHMLSLKFGFKYDSIFLEEKIFDDSGELLYTIAVPPSTYGEEKMWVLRPSNYCAMEDLSAPHDFTSVVGSKSASMIQVVHDIQTFEPERIHLDDSEVESVVGDIPSMSKGQHSVPTVPLPQSPFGSNILSQKPPLTPLSKVNLSAVDCIRKL
jgi:hypothetical protein